MNAVNIIEFFMNEFVNELTPSQKYLKMKRLKNGKDSDEDSDESDSDNEMAFT